MTVGSVGDNNTSKAIKQVLVYADAMEQLLDKGIPELVGLTPSAWPPVLQYRRGIPKVGRNSPCTCGSGKKYKRCCGGNTNGTKDSIKE